MRHLGIGGVVLAAAFLAAGCSSHRGYGKSFVRNLDDFAERAELPLDGGRRVVISKRRVQLLSPTGGEHGSMGVRVSRPSAKVSRRFKLMEERGVTIDAITPRSAAADAGLRVGDLIMRYDDEEVGTTADLGNRVADSPPGSAHELLVYRDDAPEGKTIMVLLDAANAAPRIEVLDPRSSEERLHLGMKVVELGADLAERLEKPAAGRLVVQWLELAGPAFAAGMRVGDILDNADGRTLHDLAEFENWNADLDERPVSLVVQRDGKRRDLALLPDSDYRRKTNVNFPFLFDYERGYNCADFGLLPWDVLFSYRSRRKYLVREETVRAVDTGWWSFLWGLVGHETGLTSSKVRFLWFFTWGSERDD